MRTNLLVLALAILTGCGSLDGTRYTSGSWSVEPTKVKVPGDKGYGIKITRRY